MTSLVDHLAEVANLSLSELSTVLLISTITGFTLFFTEMLEWRRARFENRINISLNTLADGVLRIRTVHEDTVGNVVLSSHARRLLKRAARRTTTKDPFLHFADQNDAWMVYHEIVLTISGLYSAQIIGAAMRGTSADEEQFFIALTWERDTKTRIQKFRILMAQRDVLRAARTNRAGIRPEVPEHASRIEALAQMYEHYAHGEWPTHQIVSLPRG